MTFELRRATFHSTDPAGQVGLVEFFLGDAAVVEQSNQWISGRVESEGTSMKSLALNQITVLYRVRSLIDVEIRRLEALYKKAEQVQR
jgi:hypothetical protein